MIREELADLCHRQWSGWMEYLFSKCQPLIGGGQALIIPSEYVERWKRQVNTPYSELPENEKESDRNEADKFTTLFEKAVTCEDCGKLYIDFPLDVIIPDDQWELITGHSDGGGILCASCIVKRGSRLQGITVAKLVFE